MTMKMMIKTLQVQMNLKTNHFLNFPTAIKKPKKQNKKKKKKKKKMKVKMMMTNKMKRMT